MCPPPASAPPKADDGRIMPLDWRSIELPPAHILKHLTDAHCHPTDYTPSAATLDAVGLGGLAAMSTCDDQDAVRALGEARPWCRDGSSTTTGPRVVVAFGYHPWFTHRFSLHDPAPSKLEHYTEVFAPKPKQLPDLEALLHLLPEPEPFTPRLEKLKHDLERAKTSGQLVMLGEIGLDATARVRVNVPAGVRERPLPGTTGLKTDPNVVLLPFKTLVGHQTAIAKLQLEIALDLALPVSFHCVNAPGATLDLLLSARTAASPAVFGRCGICIHSCGGMSPEFLAQAARRLPNVYFSPSVLLTPRGPGAGVVAAVPRERMLVESDTDTAEHCTRQVWAAVEWVARVRGWKVECGEEEWVMEEEEEDEFDEHGKLVEKAEHDVWAVRQLERNWARFMGIID